MAVTCVTFSPDGKNIVSGSRDNTLRVWNAETGKQRMQLCSQYTPVLAVAYSPDGTKIVSGCGDAHIRVWDADDTD